MNSMYLDAARPRVFAHRGLPLGVPENTLPAFAAALEAGAGYLETDIRCTSDGVPVLAHDPTFERVGGIDAPVAELSLAALKAVDLGAGVRIATLEEALDAFPDACFNIDVKAEAAVTPVVALIESRDAAHRVLLTSFDDARRLRLGVAVPGAVTSAGRASVLRAWIASLLGGTAAMRRALRGAVAVQVPERVGPLRLVGRRFVDRVHAAGAEVHVWTVNDPDDVRRLLALGVDGLVTDRCDVVVSVISGRS